MSGPGFIAVEDDDYCEMCGKFEETRPYGKNGERICFECGVKDEATTQKKHQQYILGESIVKH